MGEEELVFLARKFLELNPEFSELCIRVGDKIKRVLRNGDIKEVEKPGVYLCIRVAEYRVDDVEDDYT